MIDWPSQQVLVTGGSGFLGRAVTWALRARGVPAERLGAPTRAQCDLMNADHVGSFFREHGERFSLVIHCAGLVGGIGLNRARPAAMFHQNLAMTMNVVEAATQGGLARSNGKMVLIGSMTSYPANAPLPYREDSLFGGLPDPEIASYGVAKLAALQMLRAYRAEHGLRGAYPVLVNLYGPGDNMDDPNVSHVAGALIKRFVDAAAQGEPEVVCWGTGAPTRDFVFVEDAAEGVLRSAEVIEDASAVNIASGREVSIRELAETIARVAGFEGSIRWDASKGDGVSRRCLDVARARQILGWEARVGLEEGLKRTVAWYRRVTSRESGMRSEK